MKILLILSLALAFLVSVSFAAPSEDINVRGEEIYKSFLEWRRSLPEDGDRSFLAYEDFIRQRDLDAEEEGGPESPLTSEEQQRERFVEELKSNPIPYRRDEVPTDDGEPQQIVPLVSAFGFSTAKLQELYQQWLPNVPEGKDSSFQAFLDWMKEQEETVEEEEPENTDKTDQGKRFSRWNRKITDWTADNDKRIYVADEQPIAGGQQQQINLLQEARGYEDAALAEENTERELQETIDRAYEGQNKVADTERREVGESVGYEGAELPEENDERELQETIDTAYGGQNEVVDASLTETERREGEEPESQEEQTPVPFEEADPNDTNGGYSCEENSPCNIENIANEQFYFATASVDKFIQCDAWGGCHTLTCEEGLVWDDRIKTCGPST